MSRYGISLSLWYGLAADHEAPRPAASGKPILEKA